MNYSAVKSSDIANGIGVRISLFVSGCPHHCPGCFNPGTWDFSAGAPFDREVEDSILKRLEMSYIDGLSLLGGEPMVPCNQRGLLSLIRRAKEMQPGKTIWIYTGYLYEDLLPGGSAYCEVTDEILNLQDVLVDGPFIEKLKDITLLFRGSSNQRLIDLPAARRSGTVVPWP